MFFFKKKGLSEQEIKGALDKIREKYDTLIVKHGKNPEMRNSFEDRYYALLQSRGDVTTFIKAEMEALIELFERIDAEEAAKKKAEEAKIRARNQPAEPPKKSIADRIMEENEERIKKYPVIKIHDDASEELEHLLGAMEILDKKHWMGCEKLLKKNIPGRNQGAMYKLQSKLFTFLSARKNALPTVLSRYETLLYQNPKDMRALQVERKNVLIQAAFFLHELIKVLQLSEEYCTEKENEIIEEAVVFARQMLDDFRLRGFRPIN